MVYLVIRTGDDMIRPKCDILVVRSSDIYTYIGVYTE